MGVQSLIYNIQDFVKMITYFTDFFIIWRKARLKMDWNYDNTTKRNIFGFDGGGRKKKGGNVRTRLVPGAVIDGRLSTISVLPFLRIYRPSIHIKVMLIPIRHKYVSLFVYAVCWSGARALNSFVLGAETSEAPISLAMT